MATSKVWPSTGVVNVTPTTYSIPQAGNVNWASLTDFLVALSNGSQATTFQRYATRSATTTPVTVSTNDCVVSTELTVPAAVAVTLPAGVNKQIFYVSDGTGDANTNNITITPNGTETIGGASTLVLNSDAEAVMLAFQSSDSDWKIVGRWRPNPTGGDVGGFTINRAIVSNGTGFLTTATTTATEIGFVNGATSNIQAQLNLKVANAMNTKGDMIYASNTAVPATEARLGIGSLNQVMIVSASGLPSWNTIDNSSITAAAAIAVNKLAALTVSRAVVSDASGFISAATTTATEIGYVNGVTSAIQTQLNAKQATGNYITALTGDVTASGPGSVAATLAATSNATLQTLSALTTAGSLATVGTITSGTWSGTTIAINKGGTGQTTASAAFNALSPITTKGDLIAGSGVNTATRLGIGADGTVLTAASGQATGLQWTTPLTNPMTNVGDIIVGGTAGAATRLGIGASGTVLKGGTTPSYASIVNADVSSSAALDVSKLANGTANQILMTNTAGNATAWRTPTNPTLQKFTSGSGTYTTPANVRYIEVYAVGGGGGGAGSGSGSTLGNDGNDTTFGSALITASKGLKGASTGTGGAGGAGSLGTSTGVAITGQGGDGGKVAASNSIGSRGGSSAYFGGGGQPVYANDGLAGIANTGGGGAGASSGATSAATGTAGGAGGFVQAKIFSPSATYAYAVGAGGSGGTFGTGGANGGAGAAGQILVWEYY